MQGILAQLKGDKVRSLERFRQAYALGDKTPAILYQIAEEIRASQGNDEADRFLESVREQNENLISGDVARLASEVAFHTRPERAIQQVDKLAEMSGNYRDNLSRATMRIANGDLNSETEDILKRVTGDLAPAEPAGWVKLVQYYALTKRWSDAEQAIADAAAKLPNEPKPIASVTRAVMYELLAGADVERRQQHQTAASQAYEDALKVSGNDASMQMVAAEHYLRIGSTERAGELLNELLLPTRAVPDEVRRWARCRQARRWPWAATMTIRCVPWNCCGRPGNKEPTSRRRTCGCNCSCWSDFPASNHRPVASICCGNCRSREGSLPRSSFNWPSCWQQVETTPCTGGIPQPAV